jgi:predicted Rossmann fold flavoprotein
MAATDWDVIVLGAGAAGLMAGLRAADCGARTMVLEKNPRPGVKILMSGGTRCNLTHDCDERGIVAAFGPNGRFLHSALAAFGVDDTIKFFNDEGVATKVEATGKVFPASNKAADVLDALVRRLHRNGATLAISEPVLELRRTDDRWSVVTRKREMSARRVILTTGGQSYPGSGTTGDGYRIAVALGHTIVPPRPALTPIVTNVPWVGALRGITLADVTLTLTGAEKKLVTHRGSLLFAHFGLSGPVALDLSRLVSGYPKPSSLTLTIDLLPDMSEQDVNLFLQTQSLDSGKKQLANVLAERLPHRLAETLLQLAGQPVDRRAAGLVRADRQRLSQLIKQLSVPIIGTLGFAKAEVTAGGIALDEIDSKTMQSKLVPDLYLAGEVLDLDGLIGGYNFQSAWSTGWLAGTWAANP